MSLLFNMPSRLVIDFLPRNKHLLISWLQSPSALILEPKKIKSFTVSIVSPSICHEVLGLDWRGKWQPTPVFFLRESRGRKSLVGCFHGVAQNKPWSDLAWMHALEKEMATHSSILAWRNPGIEEPGGLSSMGSHKAGHSWSDFAAAAADWTGCHDLNFLNIEF